MVVSRSRLFAAKVFADGDKLHFVRHNTLSRILELRDNVAWFCPQRPCVFFLGVGDLEFLTRDFLNVPTGENPMLPQWGKTTLDVTPKVRIAPRPRAIIQSQWRIRFRSI